MDYSAIFDPQTMTAAGGIVLSIVLVASHQYSNSRASKALNKNSDILAIVNTTLATGNEIQRGVKDAMHENTRITSEAVALMKADRRDTM